MKRIYHLTILALTCSLLFTAHMLASPVVNAQAKKPPVSSKTPGAKATEKADERASQKANKSYGKHHNYRGTIKLVDASSITLDLKDGSSVTISVNDETRIKIPGQKEANLSSLQVGFTCMVQTIGDPDQSLTARTVMVIPGKPTRVHRVGWVTSYSPGSSITIQAHDGNTYTFELTTDTKILPTERAGELAVGSRVTIIAPRNVSGTVWIATGIVVHPAGSGAGSAPTQEEP